MLFVISYKKKHASSKSRNTFFAEHNAQPSLQQIQALVDRVSRGNFAQKPIELQKCPGFDVNELIKTGVTVFRFDPDGEPGGTGPVHESADLLDTKYDER